MDPVVEDNDPGSVEQTQPDPTAEQFASIQQRLDQLAERIPEQAEPIAEPADLTDQLYGDDPNFEGLTDEEVAALEADDVDETAQYAQMDPQVALAQFVQDQINEQVAPIQAQLAERDRMEAMARIDALQEKYPDLANDPEIQQAVVGKVQALVQAYGNEGLALDENLVEMAYKSVKADAMAASEVPAESAGREATLETGAGPSQQGEADPGDEYRRAMLAHKAPDGAF
jgi:hypothetical protein